MGDRCQIVIEDAKLTIYRHDNGSPDGPCGFLAVVLPVIQKVTVLRGWDTFYLAAQITGLLVSRIHSAMDECKAAILKGNPNANVKTYEDAKLCGVGIQRFTGEFHGDESHIYIVKSDQVEIRIPLNDPKHNFWEYPKLENTKVLRVVNFDGSPARRRSKKTKHRQATTRSRRSIEG